MHVIVAHVATKLFFFSCSPGIPSLVFVSKTDNYRIKYEKRLAATGSIFGDFCGVSLKTNRLASGVNWNYFSVKRTFKCTAKQFYQWLFSSFFFALCIATKWIWPTSKIYLILLYLPFAGMLNNDKWCIYFLFSFFDFEVKRTINDERAWRTSNGC